MTIFAMTDVNITVWLSSHELQVQFATPARGLVNFSQFTSQSECKRHIRKK